MKLATIQGEASPRICAVVNGDTAVLDLLSADVALNGGSGHSALQSMQDLIDAGPEGLDRARGIVEKATGRIEPRALGSVTLMAPVPVPVQMRDALCFELHCIQAIQQARVLRASRAPDPESAMREIEERNLFTVPKEFYEIPVYYKQNRFSVSAPNSDVVWPRYSQVMDYELEFGIFIGKSGIDIPRDRALDHVFGYTIFNDFSARDAQFYEQAAGLGPAKGKDFKDANAIGPWIVTADEIPDPYNLEMIVRVNGEERGRGNSSSMYWKFEDVIARVTESETLHVGEFIASGTVGNGSGLESLNFLQDGDVVELEVERIGVLRNRVLTARP